jgi:RNA polymerase sigma-70 factor (ECF subfamily)
VIGSPDEAADAVQEAFLRAWLALPDFRHGSRFSTWLFRIAVNAANDQRAKRRPEPVDDIAAHADPTDPFLARELSSDLQRALDALDESYRTAVVLYDVLGCSYLEIAEITGVAEGTVKSRIFRGRTELARLLGTNAAERESNR